MRGNSSNRWRGVSGAAAWAFALLVVVLLAGCTGSGLAGSLRTQSLGDDPVVLFGDYKSAYFAFDPGAATSFMLADVALDDLLAGHVSQGQILHVQMLWVPKPGSTPLDAAATNASLTYIVIANGEMGVYGGAGFAMPDGAANADTLGLTLRDASVALQEATPGFVDLLSPAQMTGSFKATRDDRKTRQLNYAASQLVTNTLGRTKYVRR